MEWPQYLVLFLLGAQWGHAAGKIKITEDPKAPLSGEMKDFLWECVGTAAFIALLCSGGFFH